MKIEDKDSELRKQLNLLLENFKECAETDGYTNSAQAIFRNCAYELETILKAY